MLANNNWLILVQTQLQLIVEINNGLWITATTTQQPLIPTQPIIRRSTQYWHSVVERQILGLSAASWLLLFSFKLLWTEWNRAECPHNCLSEGLMPSNYGGVWQMRNGKSHLSQAESVSSVDDVNERWVETNLGSMPISACASTEPYNSHSA